MHSYLDATEAYAKCLQSQVQLGADLVAASDKLLDDYDPSPMKGRFLEVRRITSLMRKSKAQLKSLARRVKLERARI